MASRIRSSGYAVPFMLFVGMGLAIGIVIWINDAYTSYRGVLMIPTRTITMEPTVAADGTVIEGATAFAYYAHILRAWAMSLAPQVISNIAWFVIILLWPDKHNPLSQVEHKGLMLAVTTLVLATAADIVTGFVYYLHEGVGPLGQAFATDTGTAAVAGAFFNSAIVDTFGSELLISFCLGTLFEFFPDARMVTSKFTERNAQAAAHGRAARKRNATRGSSPSGPGPSSPPPSTAGMPPDLSSIMGAQPRRDPGQQAQRPPRGRRG